MNWYKKFLPLILTLIITSCAGDKNAESNNTAEILYNKGLAQLDEGSYNKAAETFGQVEQEFPFSRWAIRAQVMEAYAFYSRSKYEDALVILDNFLKMHPGNKDAPYALYLRSLTMYEQIQDVTRDQLMTERALNALREVISRYPNSVYARDAAIKLDLVNDHLAGKEMEIGRFYQKKGQLLASIKRFETVVDKYQTTTHIQEALFRLTETYLTLGLVDEAEKNAAVLGHNYPASKWYKYSYDLLNKKN